jgi:ADP-heptose:LPS heptosyltransferase
VKVLVIRFSSIGDIVLTTPVFRCLKQQVEAEVHFVTKPAYADLLRTNPYIDTIWTLDEATFASVARDLANEEFDYVIDLHNNLRSTRLKWALGKVRTSRFRKLNVQKWLLVNLGLDLLPDIHIVDRYLEALAPLHIQPDGKGLDFFIRPDARRPLSDFDLRLHAQQYVAFAIGGQYATKQLPPELIARVCNQVGGTVCLLGGKEDVAASEQITELVTNRQQVVNMVGQLSVHESAWVLLQANKVITHDTGMMHIAAALGKRIATIWGNTVPKLGMYAYQPVKSHVVGDLVNFEVAGLACRPCSKIGYSACPKGHFKCMRMQSVEAIGVWANKK